MGTRSLANKISVLIRLSSEAALGKARSANCELCSIVKRSATYRDKAVTFNNDIY